MKNDNVKFKNFLSSLWGLNNLFRLRQTPPTPPYQWGDCSSPSDKAVRRQKLCRRRGGWGVCFKMRGVLIILILFLSACGIKNNNQQNIEKAQIKIKNKTITAEVVQSIEDQTKGLSNRKSLKQNEGMLFIYNKKTTPTFWMKDMLFPIDIIWIADNKIVDLTKNLPIPRNSDIKRATPKREINYVLEVNAGFIKKNNLKVGDKVNMILDH